MFVRVCLCLCVCLCARVYECVRVNESECVYECVYVFVFAGVCVVRAYAHACVFNNYI